MARTYRKKKIGKRWLTAALLLLCLVLVGYLIRAINLRVQKELYPIEYRQEVETYSGEFGIPQDVVYAVIRTESGFRSDAVSSAGAKGLMQITSDAREWIAWRLDEDAEVDLFDPAVNIRYGCYYLSYLYQKFGDFELVYAAYNAGPRAVEKWLADPSVSENGKLINIPYEETRNYVKKVCRAREIYQSLYDLQ